VAKKNEQKEEKSHPREGITHLCHSAGKKGLSTNASKEDELKGGGTWSGHTSFPTQVLLVFRKRIS